MIRVKRVYDTPSEDDGERFVVERLWPRGLTREAAALSGCLKNRAPSPALRRWFGHDVERWDEFQQRYAAELQAADKQILLRQLPAAQQKTVTLVFAAKDTQHNSAVVLKQILEQQYLG